MAPITIIPKACSCCKGERSSRDKSSNLPLPNILYEGSEGGGLPLRAMSFISRLRRSRQHRVSIRSTYLVHPFPLRGTSPRWEACHWIRGSRGSPMNPVPLPPQGEAGDMKRKTGESYASCTTPAFPPLVAGATTFPVEKSGAARIGGWRAQRANHQHAYHAI